MTDFVGGHMTRRQREHKPSSFSWRLKVLILLLRKNEGMNKLCHLSALPSLSSTRCMLHGVYR